MALTPLAWSTTWIEPSETCSSDAGGACVAPSFCQAARPAADGVGAAVAVVRARTGGVDPPPQPAVTTTPVATKQPMSARHRAGGTPFPRQFT